MLLEVPYLAEGGAASDMEFLKANVCQKKVPADRDGDTSYIKLAGIQTTAGAAPLNLVFKNISEYSPTWPRLGTGFDDYGQQLARITSTQAAAGYLSNGRKTGKLLADDLVQLNLCADRFVKTSSCFLDDDDEAVKMQHAAVRFFDIDHGSQPGMGPEVMQFICNGGTFTLYGLEQEDEGEGEFLVHVDRKTKALERPDTGEKTINGLPVHVYDCPSEDGALVTLWSSRTGKGVDNPKSAVTPALVPGPLGMAQERGMIQVNFSDVKCVHVTFANLPLDYQLVSYD